MTLKVQALDAIQPSAQVRGERFSELLERSQQTSDVSGGGAVSGGGLQGEPTQSVSGVAPGSGVGDVRPTNGVEASRALPGVADVVRAEQRLDQVLELARSGKSFSPGELIALQADVYQAGRTLELASKLTEKATSAVKQVLQTRL